ncbi:MAG: glycoside hydrolase N-terminal domain-containing protein [Candidatus Omnitrophica bacterium]|nr:glycoside hydrolase N-terminal domain-containing protein [Candidatus Omnitrophota bacterium]
MLAAVQACASEPSNALFQVDYPAYFSQHDIVYLSPPTEGYEGFPIGNGDLGAMVWCTKTGCEIQLNKNDAWDGPNEESEMLLRSCARLTAEQETPCMDWLYLDDFEGRLSLYQGQASFAASAPFMKFTANARIQATRNVFVLHGRAEGRGDLAAQGTPMRIALERWGSRAFPGWYHGIWRGAQMGLGQAKAGAGPGEVWIQESFSGMRFAVVCRVPGGIARLVHPRRAELSLPARPNQDFTVRVAVVTSLESPEPLTAARALLDEYEKTGAAALESEHRAWWSDFWRRSFVHLGDNYVENLYYLHQYLMGSGSRGRYPLMFNAGLWFWNHDVRQWVSPHHWNMQQSYWSVCAANHPELMAPYLDTYWRLLANAREYAASRGFTNAILWNEKHDYAGRMLSWQGASFTNDFTPASQIAQLFWQYYQYTGDREFLRAKAYPFMKEAAEFYLQYLKWDADKKEYYIYPASPYECEQGNQFKNTITDLGMIRTSFRACLEASRTLNLDANHRARWQDVLEHLAPYPLQVLPNIGEVVAIGLTKDDRVAELGGGAYTFCANTAPVFPAGAIGLDDQGTPLFEAAVRRAKLHPANTLAISPIAVVAARLGLAEEAKQHLVMSIRQLQHFPQGLFYNLDHWSYLSRYADRVKDGFLLCQRDYIYDRAARYKDVNVYGPQSAGGEKVSTPTQPFVQCGLEPSAILAEAVNEMLMQSYDGTIRVFPAAPSEWPSAFTLRAVGGFLVSSEKAAGEAPTYVYIRSLLGNRCSVVPPWTGAIKVERVDGAATPVDFSREKDAITFPTTTNTDYLVQPATGAKPFPSQTRFSGERNRRPKTCQEAILGKPRDF